MIEKIVTKILSKHYGKIDNEITRLKIYYDLCQVFPSLIKFGESYKDSNFLDNLAQYMGKNLMEHRNKIIDSII